MGPLPPHVGNRLRVYLLRLIGFQIGRGTVMWGAPTITGKGNLCSRLYVGNDCWFNVGCFLNLGATISIGDRVALGHQVMILTDTHAIGDQARRAGRLEARPVYIGDGAWLGARSVVLPGVTIGEGAVVAAGAVVNKTVAPHLLVGGTPARPLRELPIECDQRHALLRNMSMPTTMTKETFCETT
jgi:acetyltransferase-like isoleucine patch superfamily enzyme